MKLDVAGQRPRADLFQGYPFSALAGQERLKLALLLLAVDPGLGGVLLVGQKGTAKSTAARGLAELLPGIDALKGCPFHCDPERPNDWCPECLERFGPGESLSVVLVSTPFLTLPLGATEDRIVGGLDFESTIRTGRPRLNIGLLGRGNRGVIYVDEVNLLEPYLAHLILDAVEFGRLIVEREGLSLWHPSRVGLIGTMNPEEGSLGPQLADRFALTVEVTGETDPKVRAEIVRRRLAFEADPQGFRRAWSLESDRLRERIVNARGMAPKVTVSEGARNLVPDLAGLAHVEGHRGDLALTRTARALAAWRGENEVDEGHVLEAADLALLSRKKSPKNTRIDDSVPEVQVAVPVPLDEKPYVAPKEPPRLVQVVMGEEGGRSGSERIYLPDETYDIVTPVLGQEKGPKSRAGRRAARASEGARGRYYTSSAQRLGRPVALDATIRAAAPHQKTRKGQGASALILKRHDVREKVFRKKTGRLIVFVVDASGSVGSLHRMSEAKAAVLSLLGEAYRKRDRVGLISFHGDRARIILHPTNSVELASRLLSEIPTGGKTPLAAALVETHRLVRFELARDPHLTPMVVIMTDGRPNVPLSPGSDPWKEALSLANRLAQDRRMNFILVDTDRGHYNDYKLTRDLAEKLNAPRLSLEDLRQGLLEQAMAAPLENRDRV